MVIVLKVFGDDSADERRERVVAVSGVIGRDDDWKELEAAWVTRTSGKPFHGKDCETDRGDYQDCPHHENQQLYQDLTQILAKSKLFGVSHGLDLSAHKDIFPDVLPDSEYFWCFRRVVSDCAHHSSLSVPLEPLVKYTFDQHTNREYHAAAMYHWMRQAPEWRFKPFLADDISFATRETVGIQVADLVAREAMKELDNRISPVKRSLRHSMIALIRTGRFHFNYHGREFLEAMKREVQKLETERFNRDAFGAWLKQNGLQDEKNTRIRYITYLDEQERLKERPTT